MSCRSYFPNKPVFSFEAKTRPIDSPGNLEQYPYVRIRRAASGETRLTISSIDSNWQTHSGAVEIKFGYHLKFQIGDKTVHSVVWGPFTPKEIWLAVVDRKIRIGTGPQIQTEKEVVTVDAPIEWAEPEVFPLLSRISAQGGTLEQIDFCMTPESAPASPENPLDGKAGWIFLLLFILVVVITLTKR